MMRPAGGSSCSPGLINRIVPATAILLPGKAIPSAVPLPPLVVLLLILLLSGVKDSLALSSNRVTRTFSMARPVCSGLFRNVAGAILEGDGSLGKVPTPCDITLVTPDKSDIWMLRFERTKIQECTVYVIVFDSPPYPPYPTHKPPLIRLGCMDRDPGILIINSSTVTIRLVHRHATDYTFRVAVTAISSATHNGTIKCPGFQCDGGPCVSKSLMCDGNDNCFDGSDENKNATSYCFDSFWTLQGENWGVLASVLGVALVLGFMAACCRHLKQKRECIVDDLYELNEGPYVHKYAYRYAVIRPPKKPNKTNVVLGRDGHMHYIPPTKV